jgi:AraC-like DNA-binding protein
MDDLTHYRSEDFEKQCLYRVPPAVLRRMHQRPYTRDFTISDLGYFPVAEGHRVDRPNGTSSYILIFVEAGEGWIELGGQRFQANRNNSILLPPEQPHTYGASSEDPWKIYWFHFSGSGAKALLDWTPFTQIQPVIHSPNGDSLRRQFRSILATVKRGYSDPCLLELSRSLINVLSLLHKRTKTAASFEQVAKMERIMNYMREHLAEPESLSDYARRCSLSVSRFSETFRDHCGVSPMTYLTELRIQHACELLDTTHLRVGEIAERLGFEDALYFSRLFSKHAGMPPTAYRQLRIG